MKCVNCGEETRNPKFCGKSCSASYNNRVSPKRKLTRVCNKDGCEKIVKSYRYRLCSEHHEEHILGKRNIYRNTSIGEYRNKLSVSGKHPSWTHSHVRTFARKWLNHLTKLPCRNCGYDLHVELCHIKPVASFEDSALLSEVNSEQNVIQLCRNCHWELDHDLLKLENIKG